MGLGGRGLVCFGSVEWCMSGHKFRSPTSRICLSKGRMRERRLTLALFPAKSPSSFAFPMTTLSHASLSLRLSELPPSIRAPSTPSLPLLKPSSLLTMLLTPPPVPLSPIVPMARKLYG